MSCRRFALNERGVPTPGGGVVGGEGDARLGA